MARRWPKNVAWTKVVLEVENSKCSVWGRRIHVRDHRQHRLYTFEGARLLICKLVQCANSACPNHHRTFGPEQERTLTMPRGLIPRFRMLFLLKGLYTKDLQSTLNGLYPENRPNTAPTGKAILACFAPLSIVIVKEAGARSRRLCELSPIQRQLVNLLAIPPNGLRTFKRRMHGNVTHWCADRHSIYRKKAMVVDPQAPITVRCAWVAEVAGTTFR